MNRRPNCQMVISMLVLLLAACRAGVTPDGTVPPTATLAAVTASPTVVPTVQPTRTTTTPPAPTATPLPATPDPDAGNTQTWDSVSPDGAWTAQAMALFPESGGQYYAQLKVWKIDGTAEWTVTEGWSEWLPGYTIPRPFEWSNDGQHLYWTNVPVPDGCPGLENGSDLQRFDLRDGTNTEIVPGVGLWLALSPDETQLAYRAYGQRGLVVRDLATGTEREIALGDEAGDQGDLCHFVWSPDGRALILVTLHDRCGPPAQQSFSILRADVSDGSAQVLIERSAGALIPREWPELDRVLVTDNQGSAWWMDPQSGALTPAEDAGVWTGIPTYADPSAPARYRLSFAPGRWALAPNVGGGWGDQRLVHLLLPGCQIVSAAGHGLGPGYTTEKGVRDLGAVSYTVTRVEYQGQTVFTNYCTDVAGSHTCFEVYGQQADGACLADAELVLAALTGAAAL